MAFPNNWWSFDEQNATTATDHGLSGYNLTGTGIAFDTKINACISLNPSDANDEHYFTTTTTTDLQNDTKGTIAFWVYLISDNSRWNIPFSISRNTDEDITQTQLDVICNMTSTQDRFEVRLLCDTAVQWYFRMDSGSLSAGQWYHIVVIQNGTSPVLYINGTLITAVTWITQVDKTAWIANLFSAEKPANTLTVGARLFGTDATYAFSGMIDEVKYWNTNLSADEVTELYNSYGAMTQPVCFSFKSRNL